MTEPLAVSIAEAAKITGLGRSSLYAEIKAHRLSIRKVGRRTVIAMTDLRAWLDTKARQAA
jgi:excisionase family DNA binding protein